MERGEVAVGLFWKGAGEEVSFWGFLGGEGATYVLSRRMGGSQCAAWSGAGGGTGCGEGSRKPGVEGVGGWGGSGGPRFWGVESRGGFGGGGGGALVANGEDVGAGVLYR